MTKIDEGYDLVSGIREIRDESRFHVLASKVGGFIIREIFDFNINSNVYKACVQVSVLRLRR